MADDIETRFQAAIDAGKIRGAVLCATDAEGRFAYSKGLGERILLSGDKKPHRLDDVLYLASATKLLTTVAALQCVEDGLLTLTGDLSALAPELAEKQVIVGFSEDGETPQLEPPARPITLEMLLTHSSGACYDFLHPLVGKWSQAFDPPQEGSTGRSRRPLATRSASIPAPAGCRTLGEYMQQRIWDPLGITDAQLHPVTREDLRARLVDLNPDDPDAFGRAVVGGTGGGNAISRGDIGGLGLFMPGIDFVKVMRSLLANDGKLLRPATVDDMFQHHLSAEATAGQQALLAGPAGAFFRVGLEAGTRAGHGLGGVLLRQDIEGWDGKHTLTWGGGLTLTWFIDRKNGLCGLGAVQARLPIVDRDEVNALKQTFRQDIYRKHAAWKSQGQT